ncbi:hypothetical protein [Gemmatimonas sp.]|jgi:hypothetical protein|uniref:hypothetical protein n=1 Tax=Gemmatimonas sp. TaxID=1962908 RepID=UPI0031CB6F7F|nr:hypothetical protein [Gemmatimonas sp.]
MADMQTATAEHRSWQWELVLQYEDGSLPASTWHEATLTVVTQWYARNLPEAQAKARYEQYYHRNRRRLTNRLSGASVDTAGLEALDAIWESLLVRALGAKTP